MLLGPCATVFVSWIGAFVAAVGLAYFLAPRKLSDATACARLATVWRVTTIARGLVAAFVTWRVVDASLPVEWLTVALSDAVIAAVQFNWLRRGITEEGDDA